MDTKAYANYLHISPRKIRLVVDVVRGLRVADALNRLQFVNKRASLPFMKLVRSAIANAEHNFELDKDNLYIKEVRVDEAPTLKRWLPRAHGRATTIRKRMSNVSLTLGEVQESGKKQSKQQVLEAPVKLSELQSGKKASGQAKADEHEAAEDKGKEIKEHGHDAGKRGFANRMFRRKSG
ncbi:50S ribosomal protein L22 [Candidatus Falkowbacteria bacterium RIFOXYA2_FULL_47_9]|uniref:Large ribosomal subunit protein uL22 n=1 Tax=Candidatus Falkowbacteria bacterium RIFOXYA2_FULL_47_9 TaxID=1797995 RepID=A0A1F5SNE3_9BACT|nr:MAG: 50S ribosomal protein L22 [Candidatus Falkowbacteria bacterium RIFOXYA2_FULL_47_9]